MQPKVYQINVSIFFSKIEESSNHRYCYLDQSHLSRHCLWQALNCCLVMAAAGVLCAAGGIGGGGDAVRFSNSNGV